MTGFSRVDGTSENVSWYWEVRSVNARGLDLRVRLAPGTESLEPTVRHTAAQSFCRGSVSMTLNINRQFSDVEVVLNEDVLQSVLKAVSRVEALSGSNSVRVDTLLGLKGVLDLREKTEDPEAVEKRNAEILVGLEKALEDVVSARENEGAQLETVIRQYIDEIERLAKKVEQSDSRKVETIKGRLKEQVAKLMETGKDFDAARLHQEAVLIATRSDVEEEIARVKAHVVRARELLEAEGPVGRKLDFITQELNRESNTLCAKSNCSETTNAGLALKVVVDQMREQVQNIE